MPQLLLEILCEEIPARMQARAAADLERLLMDGLTGAGFLPEAIKTFAGPRRLTAVAEGLPARTADVSEERKGPRVDAPPKAIEGFLRGAGLDSLEGCEERQDKKGAFWVAHIKRPGREAGAVIAELVPSIVTSFPWPKSMRWGAGSVRWVRPIQRILATFDGEVVPFEIAGVRSGDLTEGHRMLGRGPFAVRRLEDYQAALETRGHVILDAEERAARILADAKTLCAAQNLELIEDPGLLAEVAGLAEWPTVLIGDMDPAFLDLPPEVIRLSMRTHQKYFAVRDPQTGALAPKFVVVANQAAPDGGAAIVAGNARVLSARLNDARFFWETDRAGSLAETAEKLAGITFHAKLGTLADKTTRVVELAAEIAPAVGADPEIVRLSARLCKADLASQMVYEFPELQGVMGRYYALLEAGLDPLNPDTRRTKKTAKRGDGDTLDLATITPAQARAVADAIADHYRPQGPSDRAPTKPVAKAVALADKLDTLVGFWAIDEKPTGSKDPFALRRAALGVIRILLGDHAAVQSGASDRPSAQADGERGGTRLGLSTYFRKAQFFYNEHDDGMTGSADIPDLLAFFADRLKVHLREEGLRHDVVDAVFAPNPLTGDQDDDLVRVTRRARAVQSFLDAPEGGDLLTAFRRAANILSAEEKKDGERYSGAPDPSQFDQGEEQALHQGLTEARTRVSSAIEAEDFADAMAALSPLRALMDRFFDQVTVNAPTLSLRRNRLLLLSQFRDALSAVADFTKLEG